MRPCWHVSFSRCGFALIGLPFLCVEAHAQAEGIDGEREDNCRTLLCRDRIERLKNQMSINNLLRRGNTMEQSQMQLKSRPDHKIVSMREQTRTTIEAMECDGDMDKQLDERYITNIEESGFWI